MIAKYGSVEAVREVMREGQKSSRENYKGNGGFGSSRELAKSAGKKGAEARWHAYKNNPSTETENDESRQVAEETSSS